MLFDLRGRGRRRTVQAIYLSLALLMGGGLVLFGIGSSSNGGIVDAILGNGGGGGTTATKTLNKRIEGVLAKTKATPKDPAVWAELARLRYQRAGLDGVREDGTWTTQGKTKLRLAADAWEQYLSLDPKSPDTRLARLMVQAYAKEALNEPANAVTAMQLITAAEKPPSSNLYARLAQLAYEAGDTRTGDLAASRAIDLAPKTDRTLLKQELDRLKSGAGQPQATAPPPSTG